MLSASVIIYCVSIADDQFAAHGWRREHFASKAEADIVAKLAADEGHSTFEQEIAVPLAPSKLASFLNDILRRGQ